MAKKTYDTITNETFSKRFGRFTEQACDYALAEVSTNGEYNRYSEFVLGKDGEQLIAFAYTMDRNGKGYVTFYGTDPQHIAVQTDIAEAEPYNVQYVRHDKIRHTVLVACDDADITVCLDGLDFIATKYNIKP